MCGGRWVGWRVGVWVGGWVVTAQDVVTVGTKFYAPALLEPAFPSTIAGALWLFPRHVQAQLPPSLAHRESG